MKNTVKYLTFGLCAKSGRNHTGRKTFLHKVSWNKKKYRIIDFYQLHSKQVSVVLSVEKDPNRSANIALICYKNGVLSYILAVNNMKVGDFIDPILFSFGSTLPVCNLPVGSIVSSLEIVKGYGSKLIRSAGCFGVISSHNSISKVSIVKLPSGEERKVNFESNVTIGRISNQTHHLKKLRKASDSLKLGKKPVVRGVAQNAVDHPHGGGRGKTSNLSTAVNFTGRVKKGVKTVKIYNKFRIFKLH